jgi:hypothetical protein
MFCPQCRAEYREGFTRCSDCDVDLIEALPANAPESNPERSSFPIIWSGNREEDCLAFCQELQDAGIPYKVSQTEASRSLRIAAVWQYDIAVASSDYGKAKDLLPAGYDPDNANPLDGVTGLQTEHMSDGEAEFEDDDARNESSERRAYSDDWNPEDATIEIWTQSAVHSSNPLNIDATSMVELSLKENLIHFRSDRNGEGACRIFVMPQDEAPAREIVREIQNSSPQP